MSKQVTIQPNFEISGLLKVKHRDTKLDNFQLYKSGRYALFFGLKKIIEINPSLKDIYIPTFVCPQVLMPIDKLNLNKNFYQIDQNLCLDKKYLEKSVNSNSIIIVINYFGFPSEWEYFEELKLKTKCTLISDNCHSLLTKYNGKSLSKYGDLSFNSFRKMLPVLSGSQLFYNNEEYSINNRVSTRTPSLSELLYMLRSFKPGFIKTRLGDTKLVGHYRPDGNNKYFFDPDSTNTIDSLSDKLFFNSLNNYQKIRDKRQQNYKSWLDYLPESDFIFLNELKADNDTTPYVFPCIARSKEIMGKWLAWGHKRNISIINWSNKRDDLNNHLRLMLLFPVIPDKNIKLTLLNAK
jgi:dTDP-4-amino-4,6-dideoxygalactose transaminase